MTNHNKKIIFNPQEHYRLLKTLDTISDNVQCIGTSICKTEPDHVITEQDTAYARTHQTCGYKILQWLLLQKGIDADTLDDTKLNTLYSLARQARFFEKSRNTGGINIGSPPKFCNFTITFNEGTSTFANVKRNVTTCQPFNPSWLETPHNFPATDQCTFEPIPAESLPIIK